MDIQEQIAEFNKKRKELVENLKSSFGEIIKSCFEGQDLVNKISFRAYTIYFNDGEECTYSVYNDIDNIDFNDEDFYNFKGNRNLNKTIWKKMETEEDVEIHKSLLSALDDWYAEYHSKRKIGEEGLYPNPNYNKEYGDILNRFSDTLQSIPTEFYKDMFGDHKKISIERDGTVTVKEYTNHD